MNDITDGLFSVEDSYSEKLGELCQSKFFLINETELSKWTEDSLKLYTLILLANSLNDLFPKQKYLNQNFVKNYLDKINSLTKNDLLGQIKKMKSALKWY